MSKDFHFCIPIQDIKIPIHSDMYINIARITDSNLQGKSTHTSTKW
jgi:hypothetical protein